MKIAKVLKNDLCLGCGLCESIYPDICKMEINKQGFYYPSFKIPLDKNQDNILNKLCPSIHIKANFRDKNSYWGPLLKISEAWASDDDIRFHAASGGVTTSLAIFLLETAKVDAILQVGNNDGSYLYNSLKESVTTNQILKNAQSRYAPALVFKEIKQIIANNPDKKYAFIGKPCDIAAIRNLQREYASFNNQLRLCISIFCAGMPSYTASEKTWRQSGYTDDPESVVYRGDGWPGYFKAKWQDGREYKISYNESWGKILGRSLGMRCKVCPDGIGELADIAIGDSWSTKDGFPDFTEQPGRCFVMIRTKKGQELFQEALDKGYIIEKDMNLDRINEIQPYQNQRRRLTFWRLLPLQVKTGFLLKFKGLRVLKLGLQADFISALKTLIGSCKRVF